MTLEEYLRSLAKAPSQTESDRCDNAEAAVRKAIAASQKLANLDIKVFAQGSYKNRTNVREDSDVDVCVRCDDAFYYDLPPGATPATCGFTVPAPVTYPGFKNDVEAALRDRFKQGHVTRGNKAFDIRENTCRIAADVVPCFEYRLYGSANYVLARGAAFFPDNGSRIVNWPDQHYSNGVFKNTATGGRFKDVVRILKRLRNRMYEEGYSAAGPVTSFLIECLVWNVGDDAFGHATYSADVREVLARLFNATIKSDTSIGWYEINGLKLLFGPGQPWNFVQAHALLSAAWDYLGFE